MSSDEDLALEIAEEAAEAAKDRGLKPTEAANALVQAAMHILETNPPSDYAVRPMWLADSVASIRAALDDRVQNVVGMRELFAGSMSPLTLAVLSALVMREGGTVDLTKAELTQSGATLKWDFLEQPQRIRFQVSPDVDSPQGHQGGRHET